MNEVHAGRRLALALLSSVLVSFSLPAMAAGEAVGKVAAIQNLVETRNSGAGWKPSVLHEQLHEMDRIRTGPESRAAILYSDQTLQRINQKSEVEILPPSAGNPGVLRVISGTHYFSSRKPKDYGRIETPTVTAAIRGTEFVVEVDDDGVTLITMLEGVVDASNEHGSLTVTAGEQAYVERGKAPVKRIVVRPRDAVAWSLYYPRLLGPADLARLEGMGEDGVRLSRAAGLLSSGQVDQARPLIESAREANPRDPIALALASVIELVADRKDEAMRLAERAVEADPDSAAAALALSFACQAGFDIERARNTAETAARLAPGSSEALARVAELRMAEGDIEGARDAAERAVRRDPSARALSVLGFVQLAELKSDEAIGTFERAVAADPGFPMARLGHGIASIRHGRFELGREEMQTAASLDPDNSLIRSYLAKGYYEEKRRLEASKELKAAKVLDPSDPTPYLYDAILKQTYNRPVEALRDLQRSIELNDNRAVYRSRLLLDRDMAVRSADLARIYNDLGFEQLGMVTARRSADADQSNYSSHLFLAGNYRNLPGFASAFLSEVLQARVYTPVNVNSVRPDVVNETVSFNEYGSLIERPRLRGYLGVTTGSNDTELDELFSEGQMCADLDLNIGPCDEIVELGDSTPRGADATVTFNQDRFAGSVSFSTFEDDGFRINNDLSTDVFRGFFTYAPTHRDQFQVNVIRAERESGDLPLREIPPLVSLERIETEFTNVGVSYRRVLTPASDLVFSAIHNDTEQIGEFLIGPSTSTTATLDGPQLEAQYVLRQEDLTWVAGAGHFEGDQELLSRSFIGGDTRLTGEDTFSNGYLYVRFRNMGNVEITAGAGYEDVTAPVGLLTPRDYTIVPGKVEFDDNRFSPKLGISAYVTRNTVLRAAAYTRLSPAIGRLQTLEPTQVAGFNQFFTDPGGTWSRNYGVGVDQTFRHNLFGGLSIIRRDLDIPEATCASPSAVLGCGGGIMQATDVEERTSEDWLGSAYLNGTVGKRVALSLEYAYEERDFDFTQISPAGGLFEDYMETERIRPEARLFFPFGLFVTARGTWYDQQVDQFDDLSSSDRMDVTADFWIGDLQLGYRLPNRWGSITLDALNISDQEFAFFRSSLEERVVPARTILLSMRFASN